MTLVTVLRGPEVDEALAALDAAGLVVVERGSSAMTAAERLAAALHPGVLMHAIAPGETIHTDSPGISVDGAEVRSRLVAGVLADDPLLAQDLADGQALRELVEALPEGWVLSILHRTVSRPGDLPAGWAVEAWDPRHPATGVNAAAPVPALAGAADACRQQLRERP